jgi:hypothetical protein
MAQEEKADSREKKKREGRRCEKLGFFPWIVAVFVPHLKPVRVLFLFKFFP